MPQFFASFTAMLICKALGDAGSCSSSSGCTVSVEHAGGDDAEVSLALKVMDELERQGFEHVNDGLPRVSLVQLLEDKPPEQFDLRTEFSQCFPDAGRSRFPGGDHSWAYPNFNVRGSECGDQPWAFAKASVAMTNLCVASKTDKFDISVQQQVMSWFDDECSSYDAAKNWRYGGAMIVDGEANMLQLLVSGFSLYAQDKTGAQAVALIGYGIGKIQSWAGGETKYWLVENLFQSWAGGPVWWRNTTSFCGTGRLVAKYDKFPRGVNFCGIEQGVTYFRVWVDNVTTPACFDGSTFNGRRLMAAGKPILCSEVSSSIRGNLCEDSEYGGFVSSLCPVTCKDPTCSPLQ